MKLFVVAYDLHGAESEDYTPVWSVLKELGGRRVLESVWLIKKGRIVIKKNELTEKNKIKTENRFKNAQELRKYLVDSGCFRKKFGLIVAETSCLDIAPYRCRPGTKAWLKKNCPRQDWDDYIDSP